MKTCVYVMKEFMKEVMKDVVDIERNRLTCSRAVTPYLLHQTDVNSLPHSLLLGLNCFHSLRKYRWCVSPFGILCPCHFKK